MAKMWIMEHYFLGIFFLLCLGLDIVNTYKCMTNICIFHILLAFLSCFKVSTAFKQ